MSSGEDGDGGAPDERYRIIRRLGSGGAATVHLAEDVRLGRPVAIKRLHAESPDDAVRRFRREARVGAAFSHPNMVTIFDAHSDADSVVIVMEYVEGETLAQALERGPMEPGAALEILRPVAAALDTAHEHGVVHRDVKPANILLGENGRVKLTDFGIASAAEATRITQAGSMLGTLAYMAPEQLAGEDVSPSADVYSLAAVAFEMLAGRKARAGSTPFEILHRAQTDRAPDLREDVPDAPEAAADVLRRGLARDPAERPASPGAFVEELARGLRVAAAEAVSPPVVPAAEPEPARPVAAPVAAAPPEAPREPRPRPAAREPVRPQAPREREREREPGRAASPAAGRSSRGRVLAAAAVAAALVVAVLLLTSGGGGGSGSGSGARAGRTATTKAKTHATGTTSTPATPSAATPSTTGSAATPPATGGADATLSPAATVRAFYQRAAAGRYSESYALLAPAFKQKFGSFGEFKRELGTLRSITFTSVRTVQQSSTSAVVALESTATHTTHVDRCRGELALVRASSGGWLVNPRSVSCTSSPA